MRRCELAGMIVLAAGLTGGCQSEPATSQAKGSTTSQAVLASDLRTPELKVYQPIHETTNPDVMRGAAVEVLLQAADTDDALLRANAIEAMQELPEYLGPIVRSGLMDENRGVRFVAAMTVGKKRMGELTPAVEPLLEDESPSVRAAAIYALHCCGREINLSPLASLLFMDDAETRGNVALILGELGNPSAVSMLEQAARQPLTRADPARKKIVDLQIAETMIRLGSYEQIEVVRAALFSPSDQGEITALACQIEGRLKDGQALPNLQDIATRTGMRQASAEIRMAATLAIAEIDPARAPLAVPRSYLSSPQMTLRAQAALTLGTAGDPAVLPELGLMLSDPSAQVQVSAAGAILRIRGVSR